MVNVYSAHSYILLVPTGPTPLHFHVELWRATPRNVLIQIRKKVEVLLKTYESAIDLAPQLPKDVEIGRLKVYSKENFAISECFREGVFFIDLVVVVLLVRRVCFDGHSSAFVCEFADIEAIVHGILYSYVHFFFPTILLHLE